jgi:OmpA-OmpF porin, OOP family
MPRLCFALVLISALAVSAARAQPSAGPLQIQRFSPAMDSKGLITLDASQVLGHLEPSLGLVLSWARRPLLLSGDVGGSGGADASSRYAIDNLLTSNLLLALGLFGRAEAGIMLPLTFWNGDTAPDGDSGAAPDSGVDAQGMGDLSLRAKVRLLDQSHYPLGLALTAGLELPTGDAQRLLGTGGVALSPNVVVDRELFDGRVRLVANVGAHLQLSGRGAGWVDDRAGCRQTTAAGEAPPCDAGTGQRLSSGHALTFGGGASVAVVRGRLDLVAEVAGQLDLDAAEGAPVAAAEALAGARLYLAGRSYFSLGLGRGLRGAGANYRAGSPDLRAFMGFTFEPAVGDQDKDGIKDDVDRCPTRPEDADDWADEDGCPDLDNDRDGIADTVDRCPNEPEDKDNFEDEDGCPEVQTVDRDGDGITDDKDKCPDDPEDKDSFEDADGCPDPDNDKDKILDVDDLCPNHAEDRDNFEDKDGCPDPDNDKDKILDRDDTCPNQPENYNGYQDKDGCPDRVVRDGGGVVEVLEKIYFETNRARILPRSYPVLDAVATFLTRSTAIQLLEVQGHADERGSTAHNDRLTTDRAAAVKRYLLRRGVAARRLRTRGYGERRPRDPRHTPEAWSRNRRVEFIVLRRAR